MEKLTRKGSRRAGKDLPNPTDVKQTQAGAHHEPGDGQVSPDGVRAPEVSNRPRQADLARIRAMMTGESFLLRRNKF